MNTVFINPELDWQFKEQGYVQRNLLYPKEIEVLSKTFHEYEKQYAEPFHTSHFSADKKYKQKINDVISAVLFPQLQQLLNNYRPVFGNWMVKKGEGNNVMPLHADWTYVDEYKYRSLAVWIPLVDTDEKNGCFGLIPGSHKLTPIIRGPKITQGDWQNFEKWISAKGKLLRVKAGEGVIYDHALLHFSPPNVSGKIRPALNLSCAPTNAQLHHYCVPEGTTLVRKYKVDDLSFFIHYNNFQVPERGVVEEYFELDSLHYMDEEMNAFTSQ